MQLGLGVPERLEEAEALQVVEVEMGEQEVDGSGWLPPERKTQLADPGARVEHDERALVQPHLDAGRMPP